MTDFELILCPLCSYVSVQSVAIPIPMAMPSPSPRALEKKLARHRIFKKLLDGSFSKKKEKERKKVPKKERKRKKKGFGLSISS